MKELGNSKDTRKLHIPIRWTWNRLQKTCTEKQKKYIQATLAEKASIKKHMCWMSDHYATAEGLGADTANEVEIVVIPKMEMIACVQQTTREHAFRQEYVKRWSKGEVISTCKPGVEEWIRGGDDICQAEGEDAMQQHSISESQDGSQEEDDIYQAEGEDAMQQHSISESQDGSQEEDDICQAEGEDAMQQHSISESQDGNQREDDICQAEGEDAMQQHSIEGLHKKRQLQSSKDALHKLQACGKRALNGRWFECPHGAVRIEGYQKRPYGFMMKDGSSMPRCKRLECVEKMKAFELSETAMMPMSEHSHGISAGEEGFKEINKVQVRERRTSRRNTKMMSCAQLEKH